MVSWFVGTMGFSYQDWSGVFYPADMPSRNYLAYYSRIFNAAEIDSTFYGTPAATTVQRWAGVTPDDYQVCLKTPRAVTHDLNLVGTQDLMQPFLDTGRLLEQKLGVVLIQLPPSFTTDSFPALEAFFAELPGDIRFAVEVRHQSWYTAWMETVELCRAYGVCWAATEYPGLPRRVDRTTDFLYLRWIGRHGSFRQHDRERIDRRAELGEWRDLIQPHLEHVSAVYGFFNNDYAGFAPATADRFKAIMNLPREEIQPPQQGTLF